MSREEWEMINEDKIPKHSTHVDFEYNFKVKNYTDNRNSKYELTILTSDNENFDNPVKHIFTLDDVTVVEFIGEKEKSYVVVSNELIHQYIGAMKNKDGRFYFYFYLKENKECIRLTENIWVSETHYSEIAKKFGEFAIEADSNLKLRSFGGGLSINQGYY